ncbi:MAG: type IV toxin-antitoxin system AbiEi family antitoxin domain-containing protein [Candidatus Micrarchaeota archaeon]
MRFEQFREVLEKQQIVVFSLKDACRIIGKQEGYGRLFLSRLARQGKIIRIERGKYCLPGKDEYAIASNLVFPSYISFFSALAFHHLTTQIPVVLQIACMKQKKTIFFRNFRIEFIKLKKNAFLGFRRYGDAFVAEPEKAIIDSLYLPEKILISEIYAVLKQNPLDLRKLKDYAERMGSSVLKRRLGHLLDISSLKQNTDLEMKSTRYLPLNPLLPMRGLKAKKWMLLINEVLA